jgi:retron-type reverse transcriptase
MKLDKTSLEWAIHSLDRHSDTDLFPKPVELRAILETMPTALDQIADIDISNHQPEPPRRFIVPKDDLSYRAATQLDPLDSVLFTALIHQFGQGIEARRRPSAENRVFSYRFNPSVEGDLYQSHTAWNDFWNHCLRKSTTHNFVLILDISDYYNQIYHHTIENQLNESGFPNQATKWVIRLLEAVSAKVSRGIPVGPHPAHLLAEASLIPVDNSLLAYGIDYCRFVDDIIVFAKDETAARTHLYQVAGTLDKQQRLQLQKSKTRILPAVEFQKYCQDMIEDRPINDLERELVRILQKYYRGNPYRTIYLNELSPDEIRAFRPEVVKQIIDEYLSSDQPDFIRLRWFIRRLTQVGHDAAVDYCLTNFDRMIPALSEVCRYFIAVADNGAQLDWESVGERLIALLDNPVVQSNEYFQISILSLFSREPQLNHIARLIQRYQISSPYLRREIILAAASAKIGDWLRELKESVHAMDPWTRRAFLYSASCLPAEERRFFLRFASPEKVLEETVSRWARK